ncbi:23S rRNA pseudouridine2457 synthase [Lutibacter oceani]|uniref:Pseudouridine synthase n=1 Tax=Lutibacter oceani TaxID=1853311 RepID=A0A3D9RTU1_9FLAO|nr:pseudouridine synthase [Lutibacter oceani]REE82888.1 23S rRNA pseudouridine2457 synthase [Lutibacter oceani]
MEKPSQQHSHFIIFKPFGYLSQFTNNDVSKHKKKLLGELDIFPENIMAIGRLDEKSEGLLLLTTDGKTSEYIRSSKVEKEYFAQVDGYITLEAIEKLKNGVEISIEKTIYTTKPCNAFKLNYIPEFPKRGKKIRDDRHGPTSWVSITLKEGKFRQVRKMTAAVGFPTLRLVRVRIGAYKLANMKTGEVKKLKELVK